MRHATVSPLAVPPLLDERSQSGAVCLGCECEGDGVAAGAVCCGGGGAGVGRSGVFDAAWCGFWGACCGGWGLGLGVDKVDGGAYGCLFEDG